ncbi:MAG: hypothetical protein JWP34_4337 [Massilia sp.]|nr:hypothetical protein [Massilia sp.]MDB5910223.1 hypothetical protein [Massilia sp.]
MISFPLRALALIFSLSALAGAAQAADACRYVPVATLQLRGSGDIRQPTVDGTINGKPAVMLVDTGMRISMLVKDAADKYNVTLQQSGKYTYGIGGASVTYLARVDDFSVGAAHSGKAELGVLGNMGARPGFDAIMGANFLLQTDLEISLAEKQLKFFRASDCGDTYLAYWNQDAMEIPFGGTETDFQINPRFIVEINGTRLEAIIDTGATSSSITRAAAERAGIRVDGPNVVRSGSSVGIGDARVANWVAEIDTFTLGSETIKHTHIGIRDNAPQGHMGPDMLLGADFLRAHRVLIAMSQRKLYVTYQGGEVFPQRRSSRN